MNGYRRWAYSKNASTGNDVVFLPATRPERTSLPRFYSRILNTAEVEGFQRIAPSGLPFDHYVWLCWSVKESVYKFQKRGCPELVFAPLHIEVRRLDPPSGDRDFYAGVAGLRGDRPGDRAVNQPSDRCDGRPGGRPSDQPGDRTPASVGLSAAGAPVLYSRTWVRDGVMITVVSEDRHFTDTRWGFSAIDSTAHADQAAAVRALALVELSSVLSRNDLRLEKDAAGCPIVMAGDGPLAIPISLAHHEKYIAYSFANKALLPVLSDDPLGPLMAAQRARPGF